MILKKIILKLSEIAFVQKAMAENADLRAFRQRPTPKIIFGVIVIAFSYLMGWPLIGLLGTLAIYFQKSHLVMVGGPLAYGVSHLVFLLGIYIAGFEYTWVFLRWLTRIVMSRLLNLI